MTHVSEFLNLRNLEQQIAEGYIKCQRHPELPLAIYNYANKAQFDGKWTNETIHCRGLILNDGYEVVARPFKKFFGIEQLAKSDLLHSKPFTVTAKEDGSLGILYPGTDGPAIATRGSFVSDQAIHATEILRTKYEDFCKKENVFWNAGLFDPVTFLFEIVYPENRIVLDYKGLDDLILLGVVNIQTGLDDDSCMSFWPGPKARRFDANCKPHEVLTELGIPDDGTAEGVVLRFDWPKGQHTRVKIKTDQYKILHSTICGLSNKSIWEHLSNGGVPQDLYDIIPDETFDWADKLVGDFQVSYNKIVMTAYRDYFRVIKDLDSPVDRGKFAAQAKETQYPHLLFRILDNRPIDDLVWKMLKPNKYTPYFNNQEEEA